MKKKTPILRNLIFPIYIKNCMKKNLKSILSDELIFIVPLYENKNRLLYLVFYVYWLVHMNVSRKIGYHDLFFFLLVFLFFFLCLL